MGSVIPSLVKRLRQAWGYLAHPYHLYDLNLKCIYFDEDKRCDIAVFSVENFKSEFSFPLQKIFEEDNLVANLHPLEITILEVLSAEEQQLNQGRNFDFDRLMESFEAFECVDSYFFSEHSGRNMIVLNLEDGEHELCMSVRELANNPEYINYLRDSSLLPTICAIEENAAKAMI